MNMTAPSCPLAGHVRARSGFLAMRLSPKRGKDGQSAVALSAAADHTSPARIRAMKLWDRGIRIASFAVWTSLTLAGCLRPGLSRSVETTPAAQPAADDQRLIIWDGARIRARGAGLGRYGLGRYGRPDFNGRFDLWDGGKSWATCDSKPKCQATLVAKSGVGVDGINIEAAKGLEFHAAGSGWAGSGWNWFAWWPPTAGTDLRPYRSLTFQIRVEPKSRESAPDPRTVVVHLACSNGKRTTAGAMVHKYDGRFDDGKWHKIAIPVADLSRSEGAQFDWETAWEFQLSTWSATPRDFNIYVDQIAAEK